jgi:hypothetical protein
MQAFWQAVLDLLSKNQQIYLLSLETSMLHISWVMDIS